jgi:hypothetical protein
MEARLEAIHDERQSTYGPWRENMAGTSAQIDGLRRNWEACNPGKPLPEWWAPLVMVAVKMNRIASGHYKADNFDDLRVYLEFVETMQRGTA